MAPKTNRRQLIRSGAIVATVGAAGAAAPATQADLFSPFPARQVDVCVIGGGFAGLTAALRIRQAPRRRSVVLIEASSRLGGRTFTSRVSDGTSFEIGGAWVSGTETQSNIKALMQELRIGMFRQFTDGKTIFVGSDGVVTPFDQSQGELPPLNESSLAYFAAALAEISIMAEAINPEAPWENVQFPFDATPGDLTGPATAAEADQRSIQTWMDTEVLNIPDTQDGKTLLANLLTANLGIDPPGVSLLQLVFLIKTNGSVNGLPPTLLNIAGSDPGQAVAFRIPQGMGSITSAMINRIGATSIIMNSPVREISQDGTGVTILSERATIRARQVIVAFATTNQGLIRFKPQLPNDRAQLQQRYPLGLIWTCWLLYDEAFWRTNGFSGATTSLLESDFFRSSLDGGPRPEQIRPGLVVSFVDGDAGREFARMTRAQRKQKMLDEIIHRFAGVGLGQEASQLSQRLRFPVVPPQNPFPDNYFEFNWVTPEFERGDYGGTPGPGVLTAVGFGPAIRERFGRVHWAGVDTSTQAYGTVNSAVQSGNRAAAGVLALL
jgi:monoamine oxidase